MEILGKIILVIGVWSLLGLVLARLFFKYDKWEGYREREVFGDANNERDIPKRRKNRHTRRANTRG